MILCLRGPFKSELQHDPMNLWRTMCLSHSWVYGQYFIISNSNAGKHLQNFFWNQIWYFQFSFIICRSIVERFPGYRPVKKMQGTTLAASQFVKDSELVTQRSAWRGSSSQLERDWSVLLFGSLYLPAHLVKHRHYLRPWGRNIFGNQW